MDFNTLLLTFSAILATLLVTRIWIKKKINKAETSATKEAPQPPGCWPIIGHIQLLIGATPPHITLAALAERYGPAMMIRFGLNRTLVVSSWELARECLITNDRIFATRPLILVTKLMGYDGAMFALSPYCPYWQKIRKLANVGLLSVRRLETFKDTRAREVNFCVREVFHKWEENGRNPVRTDLKQLLGDLMFNVSLQMVAGKRYCGSNVPEAERQTARRFLRLVKEHFDLAGISGMYDSFPFLQWVDALGTIRAMKKVAKGLDLIIESWIEEHRRKTESDSHQDFIDCLLAAATEGEFTSVYDTTTVIKATVLSCVCFADPFVASSQKGGESFILLKGGE